MKQIFVIKIGGNVIDEANALQQFLQQLAQLTVPVILVHGGGKVATKIGAQLGLEPHYIDGRRITDAATIDLVTMVYGGLVNKKIVAQLQALGCNAIGLTGADANLIPAVKRPVKNIDYGFVGDVLPDRINHLFLQQLLQGAIVPVVAPLTHNEQGQLLNTNADTIAASLAAALAPNYQVRLIYCFEKKGVLQDIEDEASVIPLITKSSYQQLLQAGKLADGILPKISNAFEAIDRGVQEVLVGHADDLVQNTGVDTTGTLFKSI